jgi:hypothetical protein
MYFPTHRAPLPYEAWLPLLLNHTVYLGCHKGSIAPRVDRYSEQSEEQPHVMGKSMFLRKEQQGEDIGRLAVLSF